MAIKAEDIGNQWNQAKTDLANAINLLETNIREIVSKYLAPWNVEKNVASIVTGSSGYGSVSNLTEDHELAPSSEMSYSFIAKNDGQAYLYYTLGYGDKRYGTVTKNNVLINNEIKFSGNLEFTGFNYLLDLNKGDIITINVACNNQGHYWDGSYFQYDLNLQGIYLSANAETIITYHNLNEIAEVTKSHS